MKIVITVGPILKKKGGGLNVGGNRNILDIRGDMMESTRTMRGRKNYMTTKSSEKFPSDPVFDSLNDCLMTF